MTSSLDPCCCLSFLVVVVAAGSVIGAIWWKFAQGARLLEQKDWLE